jgi:feruloyl esterase
MGSNMTTGSHTVMYMVYGDPDYDVLNFKPEQIAEVENSFAAKVYEAKSPDASAFVKKGGKWLIWHGFSDPGPNPLQTISYYEDVLKTTGPKVGKTAAQMGDSVRLFLAPGVYHCGNGPGPDRFNLLAAMDDWVTKGAAPQRIVASKRGSPITRPLCPYPQLGRYNGSGDVNDEKNFTCR